MKTWLIYIYDLLKTNFGLLPALGVGLALIAGFSLPSAEIYWQDTFREFTDRMLPKHLTAGADRSLLQAMVGVLSSVSGVVLSISMLVISQASSQFGPRIIRIFANRQITQWTLASFFSSTLYCLLVLWQIPLGDDNKSVITMSVLMGLVSGFFSLIILIQFIYSVAEMMQVQMVIHSVAEELDYSIDRIFPDDEELEESDSSNRRATEEEFPDSKGGESIYNESEGYIQALNYEELMELAETHNLCMRIPHRPGDFITVNEPVAYVFHSKELSDETRGLIARAFLTGRQRTPRQDVQCAVREIAEIAVRALSPGINDPYTAITCMDYLGATLARMAERADPLTKLADQKGKIRLQVKRDTFVEAFWVAFNQIRIYGKDDPAAMLTLMKAFVRIIKVADRQRDRLVVQQMADQVLETAEAEWSNAADIKKIAEIQAEIQEIVANKQSSE